MLGCVFSDYRGWVEQADDASLLAELRSLEGQRRECAAREAAVLAVLESRKVYRVDAHATMHGLLRCTLGWSDAECTRRMRLARFVAGHETVGESLFEAWMPVANAEQLALTGVKTNVGDTDDAVVERDLAGLERMGERLEFDEFRLRCREFEHRVTRDQSDTDTRSADDRRTAQIHVGDENVEVAGEFGLVDGIEMAEIFAGYVDAEWHKDWETAKAVHGDDAAPSLLPRTDAQRRADALHQIFVDAAASKQQGRAVRVVNVHVDHATFRDILTENEVLPELDIDPFDDPTPHISRRMAHTGNGHPLDHHTIYQLLLDSHIRWVIHDDQGVPIRWGRTKRLFDGAARQAVQAMSVRCTTPGCRVPTTNCDIDHLVDWAAGGRTDPDNGAPKCRRHNNAKNHGFTATRDHTGYHTHRPDGTEIP